VEQPVEGDELPALNLYEELCRDTGRRMKDESAAEVPIPPSSFILPPCAVGAFAFILSPQRHREPYDPAKHTREWPEHALLWKALERDSDA
jgi:hypothetical protein